MQNQIPKKCHTCPVYMMSAEEITQLDSRVDIVTELALINDLDEAIEVIGHLLPDLDVGITKDMSAEEMAHVARKRFGETVEDLNEEIVSIQQQMSKLALNCFGPATISGESNRRSYEVTICASGSKSQDPIQPTVVKSEKI